MAGGEGGGRGISGHTLLQIGNLWKCNAHSSNKTGREEAHNRDTIVADSSSVNFEYTVIFGLSSGIIVSMVWIVGVWRSETKRSLVLGIFYLAIPVGSGLGLVHTSYFQIYYPSLSHETIQLPF